MCEVLGGNGLRSKRRRFNRRLTAAAPHDGCSGRDFWFNANGGRFWSGLSNFGHKGFNSGMQVSGVESAALGPPVPRTTEWAPW
jgi:hypothetical protein